MSGRIYHFAILLLLFTLTPQVTAASETRIEYNATPLGGLRWQYTYDVSNDSLTPPITEFTIWFDRGSYRNLIVATPNPPSAAWNEIVVQPDPLLSANGFYDALATTSGIAAGSHISGFTVSFDWLGAGQPGAQPFEIVDPVTFSTRYSGTTVPEPSTAILLILAASLGSLSRPRPRTQSRVG